MAIRRPMGVWVLAALLCAAPVACLFTAESAGGGPCTDDAECADTNPCTRDVCGSNGFCSNDVDDMLIPDDSNPCTEDVCSDGAATSTPVPDGTQCGANEDITCQGGKCVCSTAADCGENTPCTKYACVEQACEVNQEADGTFVDAGGLEDCRKNVCDGMGGIKNVADVLDFPGDATPGDCQKKGCSSAGELMNVPDVNDIPSGDAAGDCKKKGCTAEGSPTDIPDVNDVPMDDSAGDCQKPGCSPEGNVISIDEPNDAVPDDGNPCTLEGCDGGMVIRGNEPNGTSCGDAASCGPNGSEFSEVIAETCQSGVCVGGQPESCGLYVCNGDACHVSCTTNVQCSIGAFCQGGLCKPQIGFGMACMMDSDCASQQCTDGVCCNVACDGACQSCAIAGQLGVCGSVPTGTPDALCGSGELCNGAGLCKKENGQSCAVDGDCLTGQCEDGVCCNAACGGDCRRCDLPGNVGSCEYVPAGQTSGVCTGASACNGNNLCKKINGETCGGGSDCISNVCADEGGGMKVCCDAMCSGKCKSCLGSKTGGADGICLNIEDDTDPDDDCTGTKLCNGMGACDP